MREEIKIEVVEIEEAKECVLNTTRKEMKRAKKRILFSKISSITIPIIVAILLIGYPIIMHNINNGRTYSKTWKNMIQKVSVNYSDLEKNQSVSIQELNQTKDAQFYWLENMTRTETFILSYQNKNVLIEEHYLYEGIECVLYIANNNSNIEGIINKNIALDKYISKENFLSINYASIESISFGKFLKHYNYQFKINSTTASTIESILSNLTND